MYCYCFATAATWATIGYNIKLEKTRSGCCRNYKVNREAMALAINNGRKQVVVSEASNLPEIRLL